jgi:hypothetical protein
VLPPPRAVIIDVEKAKKLDANLKIITIRCVMRLLFYSANGSFGRIQSEQSPSAVGRGRVKTLFRNASRQTLLG